MSLAYYTHNTLFVPKHKSLRLPPISCPMKTCSPTSVRDSRLCLCGQPFDIYTYVLGTLKSLRLTRRRKLVVPDPAAP